MFCDDTAQSISEFFNKLCTSTNSYTNLIYLAEMCVYSDCSYNLTRNDTQQRLISGAVYNQL